MKIQVKVSLFRQSRRVLDEVVEGQDGEEGDPGLLEVVGDGREHQSGAAIGLHPLVGDAHATPKILRKRGEIH